MVNVCIQNLTVYFDACLTLNSQFGRTKFMGFSLFARTATKFLAAAIAIARLVGSEALPM